MFLCLSFHSFFLPRICLFFSLPLPFLPSCGSSLLGKFVSQWAPERRGWGRWMVVSNFSQGKEDTRGSRKPHRNLSGCMDLLGATEMSEGSLSCGKVCWLLGSHTRSSLRRFPPFCFLCRKKCRVGMELCRDGEKRRKFQK